MRNFESISRKRVSVNKDILEKLQETRAFRLLIRNIIREALVQTPVGKIEKDLFPTKLSQVDSNVAKKIVSSGLDDDAPPKDDAMVANAIQENFTTSALSLKPGQTEVIVPKSVSIALGMIDSGQIGGNLGAIISQDMHIMDGHHRWAASVLADPDSSISGMKINLPGNLLIGILNVATKGIFNREAGNSGKGNISDFTYENVIASIKKLIESGTKIGRVDDKGNYSERSVDGNTIKEILGKVKGAGGNPTKGAQIMASNANTLNKQTPSWAPPRVEMPVINSDELQTLVSRIESGEFDIVAPYNKEVLSYVDGEDDKEIKKEMRLIHIIGKK